MAYNPASVDDKKIRARWISLDQEFAVPCAEGLGDHLARLRMYRGFAMARAYAGTSYAVALNIIDVMENKEVRLVWRNRMLRRAARATRERNGSKKQGTGHTI